MFDEHKTIDYKPAAVLKPDFLASDSKVEMPDYSSSDNVAEELKKLRNEIVEIQYRVGQVENNLNDIAGNSHTVQQMPAAERVEQTNSMIGPIAKHREISPQLAPAETNLNESTINDFFGAKYSGKPQIACDPEAEVDGLKKKLEEKLRKAEVEMSIQRARVFQQKAELEEMKHQLEMRERAIQQAVSAQEKQNDLSSRWNRQFGNARKK